MRYLFVVVLLAGFGLFSFGADIQIRFVVPEYNPYTYTDAQGNFKGVGVEMFIEVMKELAANYTYTLKAVPNHARALEEVTAGRADGFFLASKNAQRDAVAVFSESCMLNRWCWYLLADSTMDPKDPNFKNVARVGTLINTNIQIWLQERNYKITSTPDDEKVIPQILKLKRADAFLMAELVFWAGVKEEEKKDFKQVVELEQPFGMYISKEFLSKNPGFMESLNAAIIKIKTK